MTKYFLQSKRVRLREIVESDDRHLLDLNSDPEVMTYLSDGLPSTKEEIKEAMGRILALYQKHQGRFGFWIAEEKTTGEFMGWFLFRPCKLFPDNSNEIELGYRLKKKFWGQGFATEMSLAILSKGFDEYGIEKIFAKTMKKNLASQGVMKKIGLVFEKDFIENDFPGKNKEAVRFSLLKKEWDQLKKC